MEFFFLHLLDNIRFHSHDSDNSKGPPPPPSDANQNRPISPRMEEFQKKLRAKTPIGKLGQLNQTNTETFQILF